MVRSMGCFILQFSRWKTALQIRTWVCSHLPPAQSIQLCKKTFHNHEEKERKKQPKFLNIFRLSWNSDLEIDWLLLIPEAHSPLYIIKLLGCFVSVEKQALPKVIWLSPLKQWQVFFPLLAKETFQFHCLCALGIIIFFFFTFHSVISYP